MSEQATAHVKTLSTMPIGDKPLRRTQKLLLMVLADCHLARAGVACVSLEQLAAYCLLSRRAVITIIQECERGGIIAVDRSTAHAGHGTNHYRFPTLIQAGR